MANRTFGVVQVRVSMNNTDSLIAENAHSHHPDVIRESDVSYRKENMMAKCEVCGNQYDKSFEVVMGGDRHVFDSFECAIHALAPKCSHCGCQIIGHGMEVGDGKFYCCAHCASQHGVHELEDRVNEDVR